MLTVLFATRNRAPILQSVLEGFCGLLAPASGWKLVVADNASTDSTAAVIESFRGRLPIHYVCEKRPGKNFALNAALDRVEGDLTVFTDDDVFPKRDWLVRMRQAADEHPEYSILGGVVISRWEVEPPSWARWPELGAAYGVSSPLAQEGPIPPDRLPGTIVGPNMAIRTSIFESGVRFDPSVGPNGSEYAMGSETELILRLSRQGQKAWHVGDSIVEHLVRKEQLREEWILQRAVRFGRGMLRQASGVECWMGIPRHLFRDIPKYAFLVAAARISGNREKLFQHRWFLNIQRGKAIEGRIMAREGRA